jgi:hypothetical protein
MIRLFIDTLKGVSVNREKKYSDFGKMKQNFQLHYFCGENENVIYTMVWCTLMRMTPVVLSTALEYILLIGYSPWFL